VISVLIIKLLVVIPSLVFLKCSLSVQFAYMGVHMNDL
jgi:hypothetical protein